jgi:hypothetical protein
MFPSPLGTLSWGFWWPISMLSAVTLKGRWSYYSMILSSDMGMVSIFGLKDWMKVGWCQKVQANLSVAGSRVEFCLGQIRSKDANILLTLTWFSRTNESSPRHISCWLTAHLECSRTSLWFDANFWWGKHHFRCFTVSPTLSWFHNLNSQLFLHKLLFLVKIPMVLLFELFWNP